MRRGSRVALVMVGFCQSSSLFPSLRPPPSPIFSTDSNENPGKHSCYRPNRAIEVELGEGYENLITQSFAVTHLLDGIAPPCKQHTTYQYRNVTVTCVCMPFILQKVAITFVFLSFKNNIIYWSTVGVQRKRRNQCDEGLWVCLQWSGCINEMTSRSR